MSQTAIDSGAADDSSRRQRLSELVLLRIAVAPASEREVIRDLAQYADPPGATAAFKGELGLAVAALRASDLVAMDADRLLPTRTGAATSAPMLGSSARSELRSTEARQCALTAWALGLATGPAQRRKAAEKIDGLRALIVEAAFGIETIGRPSASRIRSRLAVLALERAFGHSFKSGLGGKTAMSAKASRLLAGQLARRPRQHATDARLIAQLAAEAVGASKPDLALLRQGVVRRYVAAGTLRRLSPAAPPAPVPTPPAEPATAVRLVPPAAAAAPASLRSEGRPDPASFAAAVNAAAAEKADGWPGNRKAFVSHVWALVRERHAGWGIGEVEFKAMLAEAHRMGLVVLANADLRDRRTLADVEASAVSYKNTVWHYVRVEK